MVTGQEAASIFRKKYVAPATITNISIEPVWSDWLPFAEVLDSAPRLPGVYRARRGANGPIVYIGMAGERNGSNGRPQGLRGRLAVYTSGKGIAGGLGEAAFDRALTDPNWLALRLAEVADGRSRRAKSWGVQALVWADLHVSWIVTPDKATALRLEGDIIAASDHSTLWNRAGVVSVPRPHSGLPTPSVHALTAPQIPPPRRETGGRHDAQHPDQISPGLVTQRVTEADLGSGQIRIPNRSKTAFPTDAATIEIVLRGETTICRWNPNGRRSGILRPPRSLLHELVSEGAQLPIDATETPTRVGWETH
jgi:hypothetical protein